MEDSQLSSTFETLSEDVFNQLMGEAPPAGTPNATNVQGGTKPEDKTDKDKTPKDAPKEDSKEEAPEKTQEEIDKEIDAAGVDNTETPDDAPAEGSSEIQIADFFKAKAQGLIERGIWEEFDGMEDFEWTEENYGKLAETQAEWKADSKYEEKVARVGDVGKAILEYAENGGNPSDIIDLFKASKKIEEFDIATDPGKEEVVREYYTKVVGWSSAKTSKYIKGLVDAGDDRLKEEATEAKELMEKGIQEQIKETQAAQKELQERQKQQAKVWESNMTKVIRDREDLSDKEKKDVHNALLVYNQKLPDGRVVNNFMVEFMKMQADPKKYTDLVRFVMNPDKYNEKVEKKVETQVAKKNWNLIKGNGSLSKATGTSHSKLQEKPKADLVIDYKKLI